MRSAPIRPRRAGTALVLGLVALVLAGPAALAEQTEPEPVPPRWSGSSFDEPFDEFVTEWNDDRIDVSGRFRFEKRRATSEIVGVTVGLADDDTDDFEPADGCLPEPVEVDSDGTTADESADELAFEVTDLSVPCNGRYLLEARADTNVEDTSYTMRAALVVDVLPPGVQELSVAADDAAQQVTVDWTPVPEQDLPPDVVGYLLERAGPQESDGSFGIFDDLVAVERDHEPHLVDDVPDPGTYRYRVRTVRPGPDGPVLSSILDTDTKTLTVQAPPPTSSTTAPPTTRSGPRVGTAIPRPPSRPTPRLSPPTTADTGFEELLDYGEPPTTQPTTTEAPELAAEDPQAGQSIVRDEDEDTGTVGLLVPAAGALVLVGWAGHLAYLNRLAKQL